MMRKEFHGWSNIGKSRFFNKTALITLLLISTFAVQTVSGATMSSLTQTTEPTQLDIQEQIMEYLKQVGNENDITIQQVNIDSDNDVITKVPVEPEESSASKSMQQPIVDPITLQAIPVLVSPSNGATITDSTPYMNWNGGGEYRDFRIQIDNNADFSSPVVSVTTGFDSSYQVTTPLASGIYYWRVREQDYFTKIWDNYCAAWSFTLNLEPTAAPVLVIPTNGDYVDDDTPYLDWNSVARATNYQVQVCSNSIFLFPEVNRVTSITSLIPPDPLDNRLYFWRVRGYNDDGNGPWSTVWSFTVDTVPPNQVTLVSPSNGAVTSDYTPYFDWNAATGAWRYRLEVDNTPDFSSPGIIVTTSGTAYTSGLNLLNGVYYWRVRAFDQAGNNGLWSVTRYFTVNKAIPPAPILITPTNGELITDNTPFMDWNTASLAVLYQIQIDDYPSFSSPVRDITTSSTAYTPSTLGDGKYYWRVRARDSIGNWGPWCAAWHFTIDSIPPGTPVLVSPTSTTYTNDNTPYLDWNGVSGGYHYQLQVDTSFLFGSPIIDNTNSLTFHITYPLPDGDYWWRVRAIDQAGNVGTWSAVWLFTVDTVPPGTPTLLSPATDTVTNDSTPYFDWTSSAGGSMYQLQIDSSATFSSLVVDYTSGNTYYTPSSLGDGTYYWRVRSIDRAGNIGEWSEVWQFTIDTLAPDQVVLYHPTNSNTISDTTPLLEWYATPGAIEYQILVDITGAFSSPFVVTLTSDVFFNIDTILADGVYYWKVRAKDLADNWGEWSSTWSFTIDSTAPNQPSLSSPANGTLSNDNQPQLVVGIVSTAVTYQFQVATSDSFGTLIINVIVSSNGYELVSALADGIYYWRVRAADSLENWSEWSETWVFTIDTTGPDQVTLDNPTDGVVINDSNPLFEWNATPDAVLYEITIDNDADFSSPLIATTSWLYFDIENVDTSFSDGVYYWKVRAKDLAENWGEYSETWSFIVDTTNPEISQPEDATFDFGTIGNNVTWTLSDLHPDTYTIYLNGTELLSGIWVSSDNVSASIDGLWVGTYNYTIVVTDFVGNTFSDTVFVTILTLVPEFNPIAALMIIGLCVAIPTLTVKQKLKKKNDD